MCDRGCLVDIKRTKEDVDEININVQRIAIIHIPSTGNPLL